MERKDAWPTSIIPGFRKQAGNGELKDCWNHLGKLSPNPEIGGNEELSKCIPGVFCLTQCIQPHVELYLFKWRLSLLQLAKSKFLPGMGGNESTKLWCVQRRASTRSSRTQILPKASTTLVEVRSLRICGLARTELGISPSGEACRLRVNWS